MIYFIIYYPLSYFVSMTKEKVVCCLCRASINFRDKRNDDNFKILKSEIQELAFVSCHHSPITKEWKPRFFRRNFLCFHYLFPISIFHPLRKNWKNIYLNCLAGWHQHINDVMHSCIHKFLPKPNANCFSTTTKNSSASLFPNRLDAGHLEASAH